MDRFNRVQLGIPMRVRIGLNTGEVAWQNEQPSGEAVHAASRVCASAAAGEVLVSDITRQLAGTVPDVSFKDRGEFDLKGFPQRWRLWSLSWQSTALDAPREVFVGREQELAELHKHLLAALDGHGGLVLLWLDGTALPAAKGDEDGQREENGQEPHQRGHFVPIGMAAMAEL